MKLNKEDVFKVLSNVVEPDLKKDIISLNLVDNFKIEDDLISFSVSIKNSALHAKRRMQEACKFAIERISKNSYNIQVNVIGLSKGKSSQKALPDIKNIIAVASGKGGVGKSTIASNLEIGRASCRERV